MRYIAGLCFTERIVSFLTSNDGVRLLQMHGVTLSLTFFLIVATSWAATAPGRLSHLLNTCFGREMISIEWKKLSLSACSLCKPGSITISTSGVGGKVSDGASHYVYEQLTSADERGRCRSGREGLQDEEARVQRLARYDRGEYSLSIETWLSQSDSIDRAELRKSGSSL